MQVNGLLAMLENVRKAQKRAIQERVEILGDLTEFGCFCNPLALLIL